jgi:hypothetical protein
MCHNPHMKNAILLCLALLPSTGGAGPLTAEQFDIYTQGRTLFYTEGGVIYGVEKYLPNRRVIWSFDDGRCQNGHWFEADGQICFQYDNDPDTQCWTFEQGPLGLSAHFNGETNPTLLLKTEEVGRDMMCLGPEVGV